MTTRAESVLEVLLIEDDDVVRETLAEALVRAGCRVTAFAEAARAAERLVAQRFDVVVTDLSMPGMSGLELASEVKRRQAAVPVILLSGWSGEQGRDGFEHAGVDRVLTKPCSVGELVEAVGELTRRGRRNGASRSSVRS